MAFFFCRGAHESRNANEQDDDCQIVKAVINSPSLADFRFYPTRGAADSVLSSTLKATNPYFVSTKEKREKDRRLRAKPGFISQQIQERNITARRNFATSPGAWRNPNSPFNKPTLRRLDRNTPRGESAVAFCHRLKDLAHYKTVLENVIGEEYRPQAPQLVDLNQHESGRTPIFNRSVQEKPHTSAIQHDHLVSRNILDSLAKHQRKTRVSSGSLAAARLKDRPLPSGRDSDVIEIIDIVSPKTSPKSSPRKKSVEKKKNSLAAELEVIDVVKPAFLQELRQKYDTRKQDSDVLIEEEKVRLDYSRERQERLAKSVEDRMRDHLKLTEVAIPEPEPEEEEAELPELTEDMEREINSYLSSPSNKTLVDAYNIPITRKDLDTLRGLNWLNDEIINFYLQMIVERSKTNDNWPNVYATNTFFYPKLKTSGHAAVRRWTRKVDIFSFDIIFVPVHLDVHWCLSVIDLRKKGVYFYDSMGSDKNDILKMLIKYLEDESMDKKKKAYDTSGFTMENVKDIPRQMNGSDCGMFTLKYSEYLSRNAPISFTQEDMPYFRRRMVYEIVNNSVIHP